MAGGGNGAEQVNDGLAVFDGSSVFTDLEKVLFWFVRFLPWNGLVVYMLALKPKHQHALNNASLCKLVFV